MGGKAETMASRICRSMATAPSQQVGFVGLGSMGGKLAQRIIGGGYNTNVFDLADSTTRDFASANGGNYCQDLTQLSIDRNVIVTCLPKSQHVQVTKAALIEQDLLRPGMIWLDCTSGAPSDSVALSGELEQCGVEFVDVAVSGGPKGAANGVLTAMVGGSAAGVERVRPIVETFAKDIVHLGPAGSGHAVKAVNNSLLAANLWLVSEGLACLTKFGVDPEAAAKAISTSSGRSWVTQQRFPENILPRTFDYGFSLELLAKDVDTAMALIAEQDISAPGLRNIRELVQVALKENGGDADHTELCKTIERWNNVVLQAKPKN